MANNIVGDVYTKLGVRSVINAGGSTTIWGGSTPSPVVKQAMDSADSNWVEMGELLEKSGAYIAKTLGVEAAYVTTGCYAAMTLSAAACIAGKDPEKRHRLPDTTGMKNEILLQKRQQYGFARAYLVPGGKLVEVGNSDGCTPEQLERAISPNTAAVAYFVMPDWGSSVVSLEETVRIAHAHSVPVIADAASRIYPLDYFRHVAQSADLVCIAGKYFNASQSTGFVCGTKGLVEAAVAEGLSFARAMKIDRQEIFGLVAALEAWFSMDHEKRFMEYDAKFDVIERGLQGIPNVLGTKVLHVPRHPGVTLHLVLNTTGLGKNAQQVARELQDGNPCIRVLSEGDDTINVNVHTLNEGEERVVADRLRSVLTDKHPGSR